MPALAQPMAELLAGRLPAGTLDGAVLVPVPADPWRRRLRGVDHAALLATHVGRLTGTPVRRALRRRGQAPRQSARRRRERTVAAGVESRGMTPSIAVLVDDVHTTGATLDACAAALVAAGSEEVRAVTFTRSLR
jgi:predicted amidophosphoribosyltransferase